MINSMEQNLQKSSFLKWLPYFLLFLSLIFVGFLVYVNFFPNSPLGKKSSPVTTSLMLSPKPTIALVKIKKGDEEFTAGENCSKLMIKFLELRLKAISKERQDEKEETIDLANLKIDFDPAVDINHDGKVDYLDEILIRKNLEDEKLCGEILNQ